MPVFNPSLELLQRAVESVREQIYDRWELCIADDASTNQDVRLHLQDMAQSDPRIRVVFRSQNGHIAAASNSAIDIAAGEFVGFLDQDDELRPHTLLMAAKWINANPSGKLFYSDEDKIDETGKRFTPYFKPDFNLGLLRSHNYICHFCLIRRDLLDKLGRLRSGFDGSQDYDLVLRAADALPASEIVHIPFVLYHWRAVVGSTALQHDGKSYALAASRRALDEHFKRRGIDATAEEAPEAPGAFRSRFDLTERQPLVSIIIPTRDRLDLLARAVNTLTAKTTYPNYEILIIDNGSSVEETLAFLEEGTKAGRFRVIRDDGPFNFSALNNRAAQSARGEFLLLLNNDVEITDGEWLGELVGPALEDGVGCVGARLWYPDGRLQHGGVILVCGVAGHAHKYLPRGSHGNMGRAVLSQDFLAVTAACLLVRKSIFVELGGLDESLSVAFNDVDFCLRAWRAGYRNHWTPYSQLIHHESLTRGHEDTVEKQQRFRAETSLMQQRWGDLLRNDPAYSPNLSWESEDFALAWPPRISWRGS